VTPSTGSGGPLRLEVARVLRASPQRVWDELVDWRGQDRWIPLTQVRVAGLRTEGLGTRVSALSGFWLGRLPVGLLDRFVVTGWTPPGADPTRAGELAVLHLGPYFTGEGSFKVLPDPAGARLVCTEVFSLPGGAPVEALVRLALPVMRRGFAASLDTFAGLVEQPAGSDRR
jgi:polyketide cyclase/dehydrase/lipid transport protein